LVKPNQESKKICIYPVFNFRVSEESKEQIKDGFQFSNKTILRLIKKEEIDAFRKEPIFLIDGAELIPLINTKTFVFEIEGDYKQADRLCYELILAMRLHKTEAVFCKFFIIKEKAKPIGFGCINPPPPYKPSVYRLNISDIEEVNNWVSKINKVNLDKNSTFRVACERFDRFYEERRVDDKIIDLAIAFEALFTGDITEILRYMGKIVGLGCSMLLGQNAEERKEIKEFLKKLFAVRNDIVHGTEFKHKIKVNREEYGITEFSIHIHNYLRDSIKKLL